MSNGSGCFKCGLPISFCKAAILRQPCRTGDVVLPVAWIIWETPNLHEQILQSYNIHTKEEYVKWLGEAIEKDGLQASNAWIVFCSFYETMKQNINT